MPTPSKKPTRSSGCTPSAAVEVYLAGLPVEQRVALERIRAVIRAAVPAAEECILYRMPAYRLDGTALIGFRAAAKHCALHPMSGSTLATLADQIRDYDTSPGTLRFLPGAAPPAALVRKIIKTRIAECARPPATPKKPTLKKGKAIKGGARKQETKQRPSVGKTQRQHSGTLAGRGKQSG